MIANTNDLVEAVYELQRKVRDLETLLLQQRGGGSEKTLQAAIDDSQHSTRLSDFFVSGGKAVPGMELEKLCLKAGEAAAMDRVGNTGLINIHRGLNGKFQSGYDHL